MKTEGIIALLLLMCVIAGGLLNAQVTKNTADRYTAAAWELMTLAEAGEWQRAADTASAYFSSWEETLGWLQMLVNHDDTDDVSLSLRKVEAGIRGKDMPMVYEGCMTLIESAQHLYHRDAFTLANVL